MQLQEPTFSLPKIKYINKRKQWSADQILEEHEVLEVIKSRVSPQ